ncbi:MAG: phytanoyl-CoA dioxygenase family protein, partial [Myxococcota bacterium]
LASPVDAGMLGHVQIAIRQAFNAPRRSPEPHLDGFPTLLNGLDGKGGVTPFTVLVGVFLQGEPGPYAGNLTVWPGSHRRHADYFRRRGPRALQEPMPRLELGEPKQLELRPGDVVLAHYLLGHGAAVNTSPTDRIAAYVRLGWPADEDARWALMSELWGAWRM